MTTITRASTEWSSRRPDERFLTLDALRDSVNTRRLSAREIESMPLHSLQVGYDKDTNGLYTGLPSGMKLGMTNWSFGQLAREASAPASYLRTLSPQLAAVNLNYGLRSAENTNTKVLFSNGDGYTARAFNGTGYGRIWDLDVVDALMNTVDMNRWGVPLKAYNGVNSKQATTLYASDRDVFIFLTDETRPIEVDGQTYFRGFFTWNSEVGRATFGISTFLFSFVCQNRIIWGARDVEELRIRHTSLAPGRFLEEAQPVLTAMAEASDRPIIAAIREAKNIHVGATADAAEKWLHAKGFGKKEAAQAIILAAQGGETGSSGDPTSVWDIIQAGTYGARDIQNADARVTEERRWSSLFRLSGGIEVGSLPAAELASLPSAN